MARSTHSFNQTEEQKYNKQGNYSQKRYKISKVQLDVMVITAKIIYQKTKRHNNSNNNCVLQ